MQLAHADWWDQINRDIAQRPGQESESWLTLLQHTLTATSARPSRKWNKKAEELLAEIGSTTIAETFTRWFEAVLNSAPKPASHQGPHAQLLTDIESTCLRGLLWMVPLVETGAELHHETSEIAQWAYKKLPGIGPKSAKVGNAAVYALSQLGSEQAVGQLAILKVRIKLASVQKEIEKAFAAAAEQLGLDREDIEDIGVPTYGLDSERKLTQQLGEHIGRIEIQGSNAKLLWTDTAGKPLKSAPTKVKNEFKAELKDLKQTLKDIQNLLTAQKDRIDSMFLLEKQWQYPKWRKRFLDHPIVGAIASRLIWRLDDVSVLFCQGELVTVSGDIVEPDSESLVTMWHPVGCELSEIIAWRERLEQWKIKQPFKQAHREVYLLTEAERRTRVYSNRFAAHVLRQHQFHALCGARGWKNKLRLLVDDVYPPATKELPRSAIRAEFWIDGIGDEWGTDTNDFGVFLRVATDQVRFYRTDAAENYSHPYGGGYVNSARMDHGEGSEPLPLTEIPPLIFSEIMRDVDLFVGVASVGNDPNWADGGPDGRFRDYWHSYSFGDLSGTAKTRRDVLEKLVPRLKIASQCQFEERFLVVRGELRTYKIHLGSGNILMEPNDQYLCIVPDSRQNSKDELFLPFEGDNMLSIILSKAFLLADDTKIKDRTITSQINLR